MTLCIDADLNSRQKNMLIRSSTNIYFDSIRLVTPQEATLQRPLVIYNSIYISLPIQLWYKEITRLSFNAYAVLDMQTPSYSIGISDGRERSRSLACFLVLSLQATVKPVWFSRHFRLVWIFGPLSTTS